MTRYLLTADVFVSGALRRKGEIIRYDGPPNKAMVEVEGSGKVVVKVKDANTEAVTDAPAVPEAASEAAADGKGAIPLRKPRQKAEGPVAPANAGQEG